MVLTPLSLFSPARVKSSFPQGSQAKSATLVLAVILRGQDPSVGTVQISAL